MLNQQLVDYINKEKGAGFSLDKIKEALQKNGYKEVDIDEAMSAVMSPQQEHAPPEATLENQSPDLEKSASGIKKRNPIIVILLMAITFGIYGLIWLVKTTNELKNNTKSAPNPKMLWLLLIPFVNFIIILLYIWKYCKSINELTGFSNISLFLLWLLISPVGIILAQIELNKKAA